MEANDRKKTYLFGVLQYCVRLFNEGLLEERGEILVFILLDMFLRAKSVISFTGVRNLFLLQFKHFLFYFSLIEKHISLLLALKA